MNQWPETLYSYSPAEVQHYCVNDPKWQKFRLSLKGLPTPTKLDNLWEWFVWGKVAGDRELRIRTNIQVSNYINALKRGGQLTMDLRVQR